MVGALQHMEMERLHQQQENADINGQDADENQAGNALANARSNFPEQLRRRYEVYLTLPVEHTLMPMRQVKAQSLGKLIKVKVRAGLAALHWRGAARVWWVQDQFNNRCTSDRRQVQLARQACLGTQCLVTARVDQCTDQWKVCAAHLPLCE